MERDKGTFASQAPATRGRSRGGRYAAKPSRPARREKAPRKPARPKKKWSLGRIALLAVPVAAVIAAAAISVLMVDMGSTYTFEDSGKQYYMGTESPVIRGSQMKIQDDGTTLMVQAGQTASTSLPVYLDNSNAIVSSVDMVYYAPLEREFHRMLHFSKVFCRENGSIVVTRESTQNDLPGGFLHDGKDLFVFLEPMAVEFNGYRMELPALSYVDAAYGGYITVFNSSTRESFTEKSNGLGFAQSLSGDYTIAVLTDSMTRIDGSKRLLIARPELVDPLK